MQFVGRELEKRVAILTSEMNYNHPSRTYRYFLYAYPGEMLLRIDEERSSSVYSTPIRNSHWNTRNYCSHDSRSGKCGDDILMGRFGREVLSLVN